MTRRARAWTTAVVLAILTVLSLWMNRPLASSAWTATLDSIPGGALATRDVPIEGDALAILGVDRYRFVEIPSPGAVPSWLYVGYYAEQRADAQIHAPEHCYPGSGYQVVRSTRYEGEGDTLRELVVDREGRRRLVWYVYRTRMGATLSPFGLKRDQILGALLARPRDALLVRVSTPILPVEGEGPARDRLRVVWNDVAPELRDWYERGGHG